MLPLATPPNSHPRVKAVVMDRPTPTSHQVFLRVGAVDEFRVTAEVYEHYVSMRVEKADGWYDDGTAAEYEPYIEYFGVKWDGCCDVRFDSQCALHFCETADFDMHAALMHHLYQLGMRLMGKPDEQAVNALREPKDLTFTERTE